MRWKESDVTGRPLSLLFFCGFLPGHPYSSSSLFFLQSASSCIYKSNGGPIFFMPKTRNHSQRPKTKAREERESSLLLQFHDQVVNKYKLTLIGKPVSSGMASTIPGLPDEIARECLARVSYGDFHVLPSVCRLWKAEMESTFFHRLRKANNLTTPLVAMTQAEPVSVGSGPAKKFGFTPVYRLSLLEPETGSWTTLPSPPGLDGLPLFCRIAGSGRELVLIGGWDPLTWIASDKVYVYDFLTATWRCGARMPGPRRSFFGCATSAGTDRTVYVTGGHDEDKNALRSAMAYDVARDRWMEMPEMARERDECRAVFCDGKLRVIGGYATDRQGTFGRCSEAFDVDTWKWEPVEEDTLEAGTCPRTCVAIGRRIYRCRGDKVAAREDDEGWKEVGELPSDAAVGPHILTTSAGKLVVIGSRNVYVSADGEDGRWRRVVAPEEFSGQLQAVCSLEI